MSDTKGYNVVALGGEGDIEAASSADIELVQRETSKPYDKLENDLEAEDAEKIEIENVTIHDWAATVAIVDRGCWMKTVTGTSGNKPSEDSFPWFGSNPDIFIRLLWDLLPSDWRIVSFPKMPTDAYDPDEYLQASQIMIKDITEVMLEEAPSNSFRIYLGDTKQVVKCTPMPTSRDFAAAWVNAIYAAMELQAEEDSRGDEQDEEAGGGEANNVQELLDLRDKYYAMHPDEIPPEFTNPGTGPDETQVTVYDPIQGNSQGVLGAEDSAKANENRKSDRASKRFSFSLDYSSIYDRDKNKAGHVDPQDKNCCIIS